MRLVLLTILVMCAFAGNSLLTRAGVGSGAIDPAGFAMIRLASGVTMLAALVIWQGRRVPLWGWTRVAGAISLAVYVIGFTLSAQTVDAGLGALVLFGVVQISMFGWSIFTGTRPSWRQWTGAGVAFCGLILVLSPGPEVNVDAPGLMLMTLGGLGWAAYSIAGRHATDPTAATAANFLLALPVVALALVQTQMTITPHGALLAVISGAFTSGLGYALWYYILPSFSAATAAVLQLSVPVLAIIGGIAFLGEAFSWVVVIAAALVVGGIGWAVTGARGA